MGCLPGLVRVVRRRLRVWLRSPIAGIVFRRSSSSTPCGCTFASPFTRSYRDVEELLARVIWPPAPFSLWQG